MLRGPQTPGELKQRSERLHRFGSVPEAIETLEGLVERELAVRLPRRPGQKEERYAHALGADSPEAPAAAEDDRLGTLERRLAEVEGPARRARSQVGLRDRGARPTGGHVERMF